MTAGVSDQPALPDPFALVHWRLARIEERLDHQADLAVNPEAYRLAHEHMLRRIALLEESASEERRHRRAVTTGVLVALAVPLLTYVGQLAQVLPTG